MYNLLPQSQEIKCLDHGFVRLVDVMPRLVSEERKTADEAIVQAARVSYAQELKSIKEDEGLIRYLMRHNHSSPLEQVEFKFHCRMPIFVARQIVRHRMVSLNEQSGRYTVLKDDFYLPKVDEIRQQSKNNKQGSAGLAEENIAIDFEDRLKTLCKETYESYEYAVENGVAKELARVILPINLYTEWYWKIDLKNLLDFLGLRCDKHAQQETRVYAEAILKLITPIVPITIKAWNDYSPMRGALKLSKLEVVALQDCIDSKGFTQIDSDNKREREEWATKFNILFGVNNE